MSSTYLGHILVVDDDKNVCSFYEATFNAANYRTKSCNSLAQMHQMLNSYSFDYVFLDINLDSENGIDGIPYVTSRYPDIKVCMLTSQKSFHLASQCIRAGADWFFTKDSPPQNILDQLKKLSPAKNNLPDETVYSWRDGFIGESEEVHKLLEKIDKLKNTDSTVLILGESGTGKEVVARALHKSSSRSSRRFEAINCGAIPESLLESELFGHKKGAFTDAKADRDGIFKLCSDGTLLLDEIGDMPLPLQTKLLRVLQEKTVTPLGSSSTLKIDTRVIAATHRDINDEIHSGHFREDLYYRLSVIVLNLPPLRRRREDIKLLVDFFLQKFNKKFDKTIKCSSPHTLAKLEKYDWPGNIRELQNTVERGVILAQKDELEVDEMFSHLSINRKPMGGNESSLLSTEVLDLPLSEAKQAFEKSYLEHILKETHGNIAEISRKTKRYRADIYRLMEKYNLSVENYRS